MDGGHVSRMNGKKKRIEMNTEGEGSTESIWCCTLPEVNAKKR